MEGDNTKVGAKDKKVGDRLKHRKLLSNLYNRVSTETNLLYLSCIEDGHDSYWEEADDARDYSWVVAALKCVSCHYLQIQRT